jgi:hypothetical protein
VPGKTGGKPPRRSVPRTSTPSGSPKPRIPRSESAAKVKRVRSAESWARRSAGKWVAGQSYGLSPGTEQGVARRRNNPKYVARTKRVIRPRILKRPKPQSPA